MRRSPPQLAFMLLVAATTCTHAAAPNAPGVNLRWDQCYSDGGAWNRNFACDTNTGTDRLVLSFELAAPAQDVSGMELTVEVAADGPLPAWWQVRNFASCRQTSLAMNTTGATANCPDWANGMAAGGVGAYTVGHHGPNSARILAAIAVPSSALANLDAGVEYFIATLQINHAKTVGTGSCSGCTTPVCIFFSNVKFNHPVAANDFQLYHGANWLGSQYVTWQNGYPINIVQQCESLCSFPFLDPKIHTRLDCTASTPTSSRGSTWGSIKTLYR